MNTEPAIAPQLRRPRTSWHEVMVLPPESQSFEYIRCHARTGLLAGT